MLVGRQALIVYRPFLLSMYLISPYLLFSSGVTARLIVIAKGTTLFIINYKLSQPFL